MKEYLPHLIIAINFFIAGMQVEDFKWSMNNKERFISLLQIILLIFFGVLFAIYYLLDETLFLLLRKVSISLQIKFWFQYFFTSTFDNQDKNSLDYVNRICKNVKNTNSISHRIFRYSVDLVNKKNNYIYKEDENEESN